MNKTLIIAALFAVGAGFACLPAQATETVTVNGIRVTCTNSCNVSTSGGVTTVTDCCGGRVTVTLPAADKIEN